MRKLIVGYGVALALLLLTSAASAQAVGQADVQLRTLNVRASATTTGAYEVAVTVYSDNDDDANHSQLYVFLPPESQALSVPANCSATGSGYGYVLCELGDLRVGASVDVTLTASAPPLFVLPRFTALAFSESADPMFIGSNLKELIADGAVVRERSQAEVYVIFGGAKFWIPDPVTLNRAFGGWGAVRQANDGALAAYGSLPSDGTILREESDAQVWLMVKGQKCHLTSPPVLLRYGGWAVVGVVPDGSLANISTGAPIY